MALETEIKKLREAVEANTAALLNAGVTHTGGNDAPVIDTGKTTGTEATPPVTAAPAAVSPVGAAVPPPNPGSVPSPGTTGAVPPSPATPPPVATPPQAAAQGATTPNAPDAQQVQVELAGIAQQLGDRLPELQGLLARYSNGSGQLSQVDPQHFQSLINEAKALVQQ